MLIDLDLAKELDSGLSGVRHRTGTMEFMAIEVLKDKAHTYRHDLESFFYVFLWMIIRERDKTLPKTSHLRDWYKGTYIQIAKVKKQIPLNNAAAPSSRTPAAHYRLEHICDKLQPLHHREALPL
jgi:hypothetical protein